MKNSRLLMSVFCLLLSIHHINGEWKHIGGPAGGGGSFSDIIFVGDTILAFKAGFLLCSTDKGLSFTSVRIGGPLNLHHLVCTRQGDMIFACADSFLYHSVDHGVSWIAANNSLPVYKDEAYKLFIVNENIMLRTRKGLFRSVDYGESWNAAINGLPEKITQADIWQTLQVSVSGDTVYIGFSAGDSSGVFISTDNCISWRRIFGMEQARSPACYSLAASGNRIAVGMGSQLFYSMDNGDSWTLLHDSSDVYEVSQIAIVGDVILADIRLRGIMRISDDGKSKTWIDSLYSNYFSTGEHIVFADGCGLFRSIDSGVTWTRCHDNLPGDGILFAKSGSNILAAMSNSCSHNLKNGGIYYTEDFGASWINTTDGWDKRYFIYFSEILVHGDTVFIGGNYPGGLFRSTDNGISWTTIFNQSNTKDLNIIGPTMYVDDSRNMYCSHNYGQSWTQYTTPGCQTSEIAKVETIDSDLFLHYVPDGKCQSKENSHLIFRSSDGGQSWTPWDVIYWGTPFEGKLYSNFNDKGIYLSSDFGITWTKYTKNPPPHGLSQQVAIAVRDDHLFTGSDSGVFLYRNDDSAWTPVNDGFPIGGLILNLAFYDEDMFANIKFSGLWYRPVKEMTTAISCPYPDDHNVASIQGENNIRISGHPHGPITVMYYITVRCFVRLEIYTISGEKVAAIEREITVPGENCVSIGNSTIRSGVYFYRFQAGKYRENSLFTFLK